MNEYLITNKRTGEQTWVPGHSVLNALWTHETQRRLVGKEAPLQPGSKASHYSQGDMVDETLGSSSCVGRKQWVIRDRAA